MITRTCRLFLSFLIILCAIFVLASDAGALEGGDSHYFGGNEDFDAGGWPPYTLSVNLSVLNYNYDRLKDSDGKKMDIGGFQVDGISTSLRIMGTTKITVLGGTVGWFINPALVYQHVLSGDRTRSKTGIGDLNFGAILRHKFGTFSQVIGTDFYAPTGAYDKDDVNNIGRNYWTMAPTYSFTYLGNTESPLPGFEVSARFAYYFHTTNPATHYTSGQEFSFDYLVGQRLGSRGQFRFGVNGHFAWQTTDDRKRDAGPDFDGYKTRQFTIGPAFQYSFKNYALLTLKAQWGVYTVNRGEGNNLWIKFWYPF